MKRPLSIILLAGAVLLSMLSQRIIAETSGDPPKLVQLREQYEKQKAATIRPLKRRYIRELVRLKNSYNNHRDYDKAALVEKEIDLVSSPRQKGTEEICFPAREAALKGGGIVYQPEENCIGYWGKLDNEIIWDANTIEPGYYEISILYSCGNDAGGKLLLAVGESKFDENIKPTGGWTEFEKEVLGRINIEKSDPVITLKAAKIRGTFFANLRQLVFRPLDR